MKAVTFQEKDHLVVGEREDPVPEGGEVLVEVKTYGICGTDVHIFHGNYPDIPSSWVMSSAAWSVRWEMG